MCCGRDWLSTEIYLTGAALWKEILLLIFTNFTIHILRGFLFVFGEEEVLYSDVYSPYDF